MNPHPKPNPYVRHSKPLPSRLPEERSLSPYAVLAAVLFILIVALTVLPSCATTNIDRYYASQSTLNTVETTTVTAHRHAVITDEEYLDIYDNGIVFARALLDEIKLAIDEDRAVNIDLLLTKAENVILELYTETDNVTSRNNLNHADSPPTDEMGGGHGLFE